MSKKQLVLVPHKVKELYTVDVDGIFVKTLGFYKSPLQAEQQLERGQGYSRLQDEVIYEDEETKDFYKLVKVDSPLYHEDLEATLEHISKKLKPEELKFLKKYFSNEVEAN